MQYQDRSCPRFSSLRREAFDQRAARGMDGGVTAEFKELPGLEVHVNDVLYMPSLDAPDDRPFPFVYFITIRNNSVRTVKVQGRKWIVRAANGEVLVVEGDGVVGQSPSIPPGGEFTYNSCHTIAHDSRAEGAYFLEGDDGGHYAVRIPAFDMELPQWV
jgi:ApaG protein